jgi:hypothetical protein
LTVYTSRTVSNVMVMCDPVRAGKDRGTFTTEPGVLPLAMGGRVRWCEPFSVLTVTDVGTE